MHMFARGALVCNKSSPGGLDPGSGVLHLYECAGGGQAGNGAKLWLCCAGRHVLQSCWDERAHVSRGRAKPGECGECTNLHAREVLGNDGDGPADRSSSYVRPSPRAASGLSVWLQKLCPSPVETFRTILPFFTPSSRARPTSVHATHTRARSQRTAGRRVGTRVREEDHLLICLSLFGSNLTSLRVKKTKTYLTILFPLVGFFFFSD